MIMEDNTLFDQFLRFLEEDYKNFEDKESLLTSLAERFRADFDSPSVGELSAALRFTVTVDEARRLLFAPLDEDARHYVSILADKEGRLKSSALSLLFLRHRSVRMTQANFLSHLMMLRKKWDFLRVFVIAGGLLPLCRLLTDGNLYCRGQAMETLLSVTDCDTHDWFHEDTSAVTSCLSCQLFNMCDDSAGLLPALFQNRAQSYPGGSFHALQILAFWLSWMRARFSAHQTVQLHPYMLRELEAWATTESVEGSVSFQLEESERKLACTVLDDFRREPALPEDGKVKGFRIGGIVRPSSFAESDVLAADAMKMLFPGLIERRDEPRGASELKDAGNKCYKDGDFKKAFELYSGALSALTDPPDVELRIAIMFNLASVHWKFHKSCEDALLAIDSSGKGGFQQPCVCGDQFPHLVAESVSALWEQRRTDHLADSERLSCLVVDLSGGSHTKAQYRLASCLLARGAGQEAFRRLDEAVSSPGLMAFSDEEMLRGLMRRCVASILVRSEAISSGRFAAAGEVQQGGEAADDEVNTSELSCLRTGGKPVLSKNATDMLKKLRMRDRYEREEFDQEGIEVGEGIEAAKRGRGKIPDPVGGHRVEAASLPSPPKAAPSKNSIKAVVNKLTTDESAKVARNKLQQKQHKSLRAALMKRSPVELKTAIMDLWRNSFNLSEVVMETLDEESVLKFIQLALGSKGIDNTFAFQLLQELSACSRFESQLRFAVYGDSVMSERIRDLVDVLKNNLGEGKSCLDELSVYVAVIQ